MTAETTTQARAAGSSVRAAKKPRTPLGLSFFAFMHIGAHDGAQGVLLPSIIAHYGITTATASLIFPAGTVGYLAAALNSGLLLEYLGRRAFLLLGTGAVLTGAVLALTAPPFPLLLPAFLLLGSGLAILDGYWLGLLVGRIALGRVADHWGVGRLLQGCITGVVVAVLLVWVAPAGALAALGLWLAGFCLGPIFPSTIALIGATTPPRMQQSAIGFTASLGAMGSATFPWLAGNLVERAGLWALLPFVAGLSLVLFGLWLALRHVVRTR